MLNIEQAVQQKFPKFEHSRPWIKKSTISFLRKITHEQEVNRFLDLHQDLKGFDFIEQVLDYFNFSYSISHRDRNNIPATGRVVIVANHPLGALDGLSLLKLVGEVRRDVKIVANDMLGLNRFTEQQFIGSGDAIKTGKIGMIYGADVHISSNCPTTTTANTATDRVGCLLHKDALVLAEQVGVRSQTQYKQEYLGDLFTSDTIYGVAELRNDAGVAFVVPGT